MSYQSLTTASNIKISDFSPRYSGENAARSEWQEVPYDVFANLSVRERASLADDLATNNTEVHIKTATGYGRARIFIKA